MKILITSVGRRVELIQAFCAAADRLNVELEIWGADISNMAPALQFCHKQLIVPLIKDAQYIPFLQETCEINGIDAIIPTIDTDLLIFAEKRENFGNTKVIISKPEKVAVCRDKRYTAEYFTSLGLNSPHPVDDWEKYDGSFPAFIKPKDGSSSIFAYKVNSESELKEYAKRVPEYIVQPYIEGEEYTVDIFCDFEGNPVLITPRKRLAVRAGEVLKTEICQDERIISEIKKLASDFKPCGQITVQLIREKNSSIDYYIEINPRFGGGAPLSIKAGADSAEMLIRLLNGEKLDYIEHAAENGVVYSRFDQSVRVR